MNSENNKTSNLHRLLLSITDKQTWEEVKKVLHQQTLSSIKTNKFKMSATTWIDKFELPDGSYSILDIQYYFEHIKNMKYVPIIFC